MEGGGLGQGLQSRVQGTQDVVWVPRLKNAGPSAGGLSGRQVRGHVLQGELHQKDAPTNPIGKAEHIRSGNSCKFPTPEGPALVTLLFVLFYILNVSAKAGASLDLAVSRAPTAHPNICTCAKLKFTVPFHLMEIISYLEYHSSTCSFI